MENNSENPTPPDVSSIMIPDELSSPSNVNRKKILKFFTDIIVIIITGLILAALIKTFVVRSFYIPSESMEPTLMVNDRVLVEEISPKFNNIKKGDIIVFKDNQGWISKQDNKETTFTDNLANLFTLTEEVGDEYLVKRVIGVGGDTVECCTYEGNLTINGEVQHEMYTKKGHFSGNEYFKVTVPKDSFWVMGDNRANSADSRYHTEQNGGFIPLEDVVGRVIVKVYPLDKITLY